MRPISSSFPSLTTPKAPAYISSSCHQSAHAHPLIQNACRKQKMRCEGADNPPCRRCRHAGLECLFEKPSREATLTGEAGLEYVPSNSSCLYLSLSRRIRSLEGHVADIRVTQAAIQNTLLEIVAHLRGTAPFNHRSPSTFSQGQYTQSPTIPSVGSPPVSATSNGSHIGDPNMHHGPPTPTSYHPSIQPILNPPSRELRSSGSHATVGDFHSPQLSSSHTNPANAQPFSFPPSGAVLPPFSSIGAIGTGNAQGPSTLRYLDDSQRSHTGRSYPASAPAGAKRIFPPSSNVTSAGSSEVEDEDNGELPASGLVAPWEVLRGLADVAIERAAKVSTDAPRTRFLNSPMMFCQGEWRSKQRTPEHQNAFP